MHSDMQFLYINKNIIQKTNRDTNSNSRYNQVG